MSTGEADQYELGRNESRVKELVREHEAQLNEVADLVAHVRHEINNPLTGVIGQTQLLLREELTDGARKRVETIEQLAMRIKDTVARLREIQRPIPKYPNETGIAGQGPARH